MSGTALRIDPPLPCAARKPAPRDPNRRCGQPATIAQADILDDGSWLILPLCRTCVAATARVYGITASGKEGAEEGAEG
jgi:hypothetical protein